MIIVRVAAILAISSVAALSQDVISARSGLIHFTQGAVTLDGQQLVHKAAEFKAMKDGSVLETKLGRAEILLSPGVFLRIAEDSSVRMIRSNLEDTKLALLSGSALLEVGELSKDQSLTMSVGERTVNFPRKGLFRLDFDPSQIAAFDGSADVIVGDDRVTVKEGREAALSGPEVKPVKFDKDDTDAFHRWASRRSGYISMANFSAAKRVSDSDSIWRGNNWIYNPYFGMFTYLPMSGMYRSPFGYSFYSPRTIYRVYYRPDPGFYGGGYGAGGGRDAGTYSPSVRGMSNMGGRSMGSYSSGGSMAAPPPSSAPAAPAAAGRSGSAGGGASRGTSGGR